jgi:hypothetical protein
VSWAYLAAAVSPAPAHDGMDPAWITALLGLIAAVFGCIAWGFRWAWRVVKRVTHFLDDFLGEEARDGLPARPGVMARLATAEALLARLVAETQPNHGTTLHDFAVRTAQDVADIKQEQSAVRARLEHFESRRAGR